MGRSRLPCASLARLRWRDILEQNGIHIRRWQFCKLYFPLVIVSMVALSAVLVGEAYVVHKNTFVMVFTSHLRCENSSGELIGFVNCIYLLGPNKHESDFPIDPRSRIREILLLGPDASVNRHPPQDARCRFAWCDRRWRRSWVGGA
jgi:hypothetical protein